MRPTASMSGRVLTLAGRPVRRTATGAALGSRDAATRATSFVQQTIPYRIELAAPGELPDISPTWR